MCKGAVAAPLPLQAIVYPILRKKSLHFCEKIEKYENFIRSVCFAQKARSKVDFYACFASSAACSLPCST